jgi:ubiquinone/menaquinone biosynthesis C-methylase UbiE
MRPWQGPLGWYTRYIFPHIMDWSLRQPIFQHERRIALAPAYGKVLEVGFGTGLNLPHYPAIVTSLTAVDPHPVLPKRVAQRLAATHIPVTRRDISAVRLPFASATFDCVVTTWTLCTIPEVVRALHEMRRVLKCNGRYVFLEHGRSDSTRVAWWQDVCNPLQRCIAGGCNLNRPIAQLIAQAGFEITTLERFLMPGLPRLFSKMFRGIARPAQP